MEVTMNECLFKPDEQTVFLKDSSCGLGNSIVYDSADGVYRIDADLNGCGTTQSMGNNEVTFFNQVSATSDDDPNAIISFGTTTTIDLSCSYPLTYDITKDVEDENLPTISWNFDFYTDSSYSTVKSSSQVTSGQKVFLRIEPSEAIPNSLVYAISACRAYQVSDPSSSYTIYRDGCENSRVGTERYNANSLAFNMFRFSGGDNNVKLACTVEICMNGENDPRCEPVIGCNGDEVWST